MTCNFIKAGEECLWGQLRVVPISFSSIDLTIVLWKHRPSDNWQTLHLSADQADTVAMLLEPCRKRTIEDSKNSEYSEYPLES
jgi:hypothetical protein